MVFVGTLNMSDCTVYTQVRPHTFLLEQIVERLCVQHRPPLPRDSSKGMKEAYMECWKRAKNDHEIESCQFLTPDTAPSRPASAWRAMVAVNATWSTHAET